MKIAFFSDCYLDLSGGIVSNINAEKAELERQGHTVYVFSSAYPHSENEIKKLFVRLMHDKKVIYKVSLDETVDLPSVVRINLQYLAKLAGYSDDLYASAKEIASEEKYSACVTEPQKLPKRDQDLIDYHGSRNDFAKYDLDYSGV